MCNFSGSLWRGINVGDRINKRIDMIRIIRYGFVQGGLYLAAYVGTVKLIAYLCKVPSLPLLGK
jgi:hypothetical protein